VASEEFKRDYYRPYIEHLRTGSIPVIRHGRSFRLRSTAYDPIDNEFIYVGLEKAYQDLDQPNAPFQFQVDEIDEATFHCGTDGIVVASSKRPDRI
jgi:hypothetical protein